ncbi:MAG: phosphomethylpyrimidine synthase ThiC [Candidatus Bathyarchaeota archaeon]|nr:phosphomethylpyrimidine synthase ThiC [Candidatus Bathyarchaeota archaeon]
MTTQMEYAKSGKVTDEMVDVAKKESLSPGYIMHGLAEGRIVITRNLGHEIPAMGIGEGLRIKVNANIGTSRDICDVDAELLKAKTAHEAGADTLMDLSTGGDIDTIRRMIMEATPLPIGTVPIYQAAIMAQEKRGAIVDMTEDDLFNTIERNAKDGVDFITVHCGINKVSVDRIKRSRRLTGIVSRGGTFLAAWIMHNDRENPLYGNYDYLLEIAKKYDVTLSLGDGLRPGCIQDATDGPQIQELIVIGELVDRARATGVQVMVEGPGHVPIDQIDANVKLEKAICNGAPFYVLGPLVTDIAPGYDHIVGAIGGAVAAMAGADYLCYVTPTEHIGLPDVEDVREGVIVSRIAAHAGDLVRRRDKAIVWDNDMSKARADLDWRKQIDLSINPARVRKVKEERSPGEMMDKGCSMCGEFCAIKILKEYMRAEH